jgi:hypothetical protein
MEHRRRSSTPVDEEPSGRSSPNEVGDLDFSVISHGTHSTPCGQSIQTGK